MSKCEKTNCGKNVSNNNRYPSHRNGRDLCKVRRMIALTRHWGRPAKLLAHRVSLLPSRSGTALSHDRTSTPSTHGQLGALTKIISDEAKYSGEMYDVFDIKLKAFHDKCSEIGIEKHQLAPAFSLMLKGKALTFYLTRISGKGIRDLTTMVAQVRAHFENNEASQTKLEVLEKLIDKLTLIQRALPTSYYDDEVLRSQLLNACSGVRECEMCLFNPTTTLE
ncbi:hypothetical protein CSUB01_11285 [Colletotrichum sublineola]|uniref:Uncharacterized protein n=1 Tax=Colletotrichum sublineola TaxID=1173701 RepID=A0A066WYT0_COLSU|nr:hypothetical protein CSUB01_11285 [Colletotrichum sublineola]